MRCFVSRIRLKFEFVPPPSPRLLVKKNFLCILVDTRRSAISDTEMEGVFNMKREAVLSIAGNQGKKMWLAALE